MTAMPMYEYSAMEAGSCSFCTLGWTTLQKLTDPPLCQCPKCGAPVKKLITAPNVLKHSDGPLNQRKIEQSGFTQYRRLEKGVYEKTAGTGPRILKDSTPKT